MDVNRCVHEGPSPYLLTFIGDLRYKMLSQTNPVNRIANLPSFFMRLTGICDYSYQTNIRKFTALLDFCCPYACYLTPLVCYSLTPNVEISRTGDTNSGGSW